MDCEYVEEVIRGEEKINLQKEGLDEKLFGILGETIPPGGSLMVAYVMFSNRSKIHEETARGLGIGVPPVATPLGYLMFKAGCGVNFKDWYIPEGGMEGPQKLQGFKALDKEHEDRRKKEMVLELKRFVGGKVSYPGIEEPALERAKRVLGILEG
ncbi:MAG: DUF1122 family protein, partial [Candidatus Altiarchaeota archaeon]|nr:DUF1122 family protein [Candidatus Altiarchaeota archaeon]